jgi:pimeloyl-ACP methyl ester carboxylesterase
VHANQHLIHRFLTEVTGSPAVLMGNSMGGLLAVVQATSAPTTTAGVVLIAPALPTAGIMVGDLRMILEFAVLATPGLGAMILGLWTRLASAEAQVARTLRIVTDDPTRLPREVMEAAIAQAEVRRQFSGTARHVVEAARSVVLMSQSRNYVRRLRELATPVLLIHGGRDRVVSARSAQAAAARRPEWTFHLIEDVGHVPQLEQPEATAATILQWLTENPDVVQDAALA